jgi:hypothetical protein
VDGGQAIKATDCVALTRNIWAYGVVFTGMTYEEAPACDRHETKVPMQLRTMHSDSSRPEVVVGLFECPECGHERRLPIRTSDAA